MDRVDYESLTIQDLLGAYEREELNIAPWYQRRSVWRPPQQAYLINTIFERKPVPSLYIRHTIDLESERSIKEVVDGQQRIRSLISYKEDEFPAKHPEHPRKVLYSQLSKAQKGSFLLTALSVGYLIGSTDQDVIQIFARINSVAKTLNPQEKRNALFSGAFKQFSVSEAATRLPLWRDYRVFSDIDISRMLEVQFISDLAMNMREGLQDFSGPRLSKYYKSYDDDFPSEVATSKRMERAFAQVLSISADKLRNSIFVRPQILFSLLLEVDSLGTVSKKNLERCISDITDSVVAFKEGEDASSLKPDQYEAFTTGNMHRIQFRKKRSALIRAKLK